MLIIANYCLISRLSLPAFQQLQPTKKDEKHRKTVSRVHVVGAGHEDLLIMKKAIDDLRRVLCHGLHFVLAEARRKRLVRSYAKLRTGTRRSSCLDGGFFRVNDG